MITAKNYAAQAETGLNWFCEYLELCGCKDDITSVYGIQNTIRESIKFCIEDNGRIFNDGLKALKGNRINLPFKNTCIEYHQHNEHGLEDSVINEGYTLERISKVLLICSDIECISENMPIEYNDSIVIAMATFFEKDKRWQLSEAGLIVKKDFFIDGLGLHAFSPIPDYFKLCQSKYHISEDDRIKSEMPYLKAVFEFLEALSCRNVDQSIYQPASPKNAQRIKSHKLPIYETRFLTIKPTVKEYAKNGTVSSHASPRQHLRRGHIRRLETGNIWVNSCVVGDATKGIIDKTYKVVKN
jgi:hypothetical protein